MVLYEVPSQTGPTDLGARSCNDYINSLSKGICLADLEMDCNVLQLCLGNEARCYILDTQLLCWVEDFLIYCDFTHLKETIVGCGRVAYKTHCAGNLCRGQMSTRSSYVKASS